MPNLDSLRNEYRVLNYCVYDDASEAEQKKGIRLLKAAPVYPTYPWKANDGEVHTNDNPVWFTKMCEDAGMIQRIRKSDMEESDEKPITYSEWVRIHQIEPDFVNNLEGGGGFKKL